ncbi:MAG: hypothetical protein ACLPV8_13975 [Steroidobacteraceae bacterium]
MRSFAKLLARLSMLSLGELSGVQEMGPELAQTVDAAGSRKSHVAHKQISGEYAELGLEQGIECCASTTGEGMGWRFQINPLPNEDIQFVDGAPQTFELRKVRVQIEGNNASQQIETIKRALELNRSGGAISLCSRAEPEEVIHGDAEPCQHGASEAADTL